MSPIYIHTVPQTFYLLSLHITFLKMGIDTQISLYTDKKTKKGNDASNKTNVNLKKIAMEISKLKRLFLNSSCAIIGTSLSSRALNPAHNSRKGLGFRSFCMYAHVVNITCTVVSTPFQ